MSRILRQTREAKGITLEDVAQRTYIKLPYLSALEDGCIEAHLAPVFVHGYIRQYARLLGLNAAELVQQYQQEFKREHPRLAPAPVLSTADAPRSIGSADGQANGSANGSAGGSGNGSTSGLVNGHHGHNGWTPISATEVHLVERTVTMERPTPLSYSGENGHASEPHGDIASAQAEAQRIIAEAQRDADRMRREAREYAYQVLSDLEAELGRSLAVIKNGRQFLQQRRRHGATVVEKA
ncbi:MAG: helix-turn-helix domain-containing protein [Candidatus Sericytochromatia bacterium]|uniref:Helix-turn-helix domain-containing protein n=1 Tax=Candidatus Tanganyikabacteria bacterium TaxID=2961651 RepID=A0A937X5A2_9BACT|nr:helix-turn-helix domain-containing protein [Candidatus Tanganyikabacteria bacterium]